MNKSENASCYWFIFIGEQLLLQQKEENLSVPFGAEPPLPVLTLQKVTMYDGRQCFAAESSVVELPEGFITVPLRKSFLMIESSLYEMAGKSFQILFWDKHSQFCPVCGTKTQQLLPIMKVCPNCHFELYPTVSTAILVLIRKGNSILLVHSRNFKGNFYGLVSGFLEAGESLEQCVTREVMEETSLTIKNLTYFGNQTWPYPNNLMVGFIADYESGTIKLQEDELSAGEFFTLSKLPEIPTKPSLARSMIDWWIEHHH